MEKLSHYIYSGFHRTHSHRQRIITFVSLITLLLIGSNYHTKISDALSLTHTPLHASATLARCNSLNTVPGPPPDFHDRLQSDRFVPGTRPTLIKNARIWTGGLNGTEVVSADILLDKGMIKRVGRLGRSKYKEELVVVDAKGAWVTPGIVDMHSHLGDNPSPELSGASDGNSIKGTIQAWLRSLDGLNTHDDAYVTSVAGGVTTSLILPGSANAIGGQAFVIKLRKTAERSPSAMLLEPPYTINESYPITERPRWRQMKQACGENPSAVYHNTRMDTMWAFREAYNKAREIKGKQDTYCSKAFSGDWEGLGEFPEELRWEALVDVLRGKVKIHTHCYEAVDFDGLVRLSNEFQFPLAAVHHASEAYLVPDLLKAAHGPPPAVALFATNARYKREAYRSSEFAPRILAQNGLRVVMKSDHPVMNSRYLLYEAQQAYFYGLPENLALASVTSTPASVMGLDHRIGHVREGWDADLVIWDSHPLALGATPTQVYIDGIAQIPSPYIVEKPASFQRLPKVPKFDREAADAVKFEGLPPIAPRKAPSDLVMFTNVKNIFLRDNKGIQNAFSSQDDEAPGVFVVQNGKVLCSGMASSCGTAGIASQAHIVDLHGGSISPGLVSFGSPLGLEAIALEPSTNDGEVLDPFIVKIPSFFGDGALVRAVDGLEYGTRDAFLAYRSGVTRAVTAPSHEGFWGGLGTAFSLGSGHKLEDSAVVQEVTAVHLSVRYFGVPSVSTQIAALRRLLLNGSAYKSETGYWFDRVAKGEMPLVVEAHSADIIATLILLKKEIEEQRGNALKLTITGASEAHLLARELGEAGVGVIVNPVRPFPYRWEDRRILPGPPLSGESAIARLVRNNVTVAIGIEEIWSARNTRFDVAWAALEANGTVSMEQALALASTNVEKLLGVHPSFSSGDLVATRGGGLFDMEGQVVAVISPSRRLVDLTD